MTEQTEITKQTEKTLDFSVCSVISLQSHDLLIQMKQAAASGI
jgi:hypothetical protein